VVNGDESGTRNLLECCREVQSTTGSTPRLVLSSSIAAFGADKEVSDSTKHTPLVSDHKISSPSSLIIIIIITITLS